MRGARLPIRGYSIVVICDLPKVERGVRFSLPAHVRPGLVSLKVLSEVRPGWCAQLRHQRDRGQYFAVEIASVIEADLGRPGAAIAALGFSSTTSGLNLACLGGYNRVEFRW